MCLQERPDDPTLPLFVCVVFEVVWSAGILYSGGLWVMGDGWWMVAVLTE